MPQERRRSLSTLIDKFAAQGINASRSTVVEAGDPGPGYLVLQTVGAPKPFCMIKVEDIFDRDGNNFQEDC